MKPIFLLSIAFLVLFASCSKDSNTAATPAVPLSKRAILTRTSWKRIKAVWGDTVAVSVANNGSVTIVKTVDYFNTILRSYDKDNIFKWSLDGAFTYNEGSTVNPDLVPLPSPNTNYRAGLWAWAPNSNQVLDSTVIEETWIVAGSTQKLKRYNMVFKYDTLQSTTDVIATNANGVTIPTTLRETFLRVQ